MKNKNQRNYNKRTWLNSTDSPSTWNVVAFDGLVTIQGKPKHQTFFVVSDCHCSARLHKTEDDSMEDFILKLRTLACEATKFANYLMSNQSN